jgi:hypothetical protein
VYHIGKRGFLAQPSHLVQQLRAGLTTAAVWSPSNALDCCRLLCRDNKLIVKSKGSDYSSVHADDHAKAKAKLFQATAFPRPRVCAVLALLLEARDGAASS